MAWLANRRVWLGMGLFLAGSSLGFGLPLALLASDGQATEPASLASRASSEPRGAGAASARAGAAHSRSDPTLRYRIASQVSGRGFEGIGASPVNMEFHAVYALDTLERRGDGGRTMSLEWEDVAFAGDFMLSPFQMRQGGGHASMSMNGRTYVDTARGVGSPQGLPQLAFFREPIEMEVDARGEVEAIRGPAGFDAMLPAISSPGPSEMGTQLGSRWTSHINLPIPGLGQPVRATLVNEVVGYRDIAGRRCAVVRQDWTSAQRDGALNSPESVLGESMAFSMPLFDVQGVNMIYSDVRTGDLVRSDLDLRFVLRIGQALGDNEMLHGLTSQLAGGLFGGATEGVPEFDGLGARPPQDLLKLEVGIRGTIELLEAVPPNTEVQSAPPA